jgi:hypothetical protein
MKSLAHKLLACTFIIAMATGCASVTDAGMTRDNSTSTPAVTQPKPDNPGFSTDQDMSPIVDKPV